MKSLIIIVGLFTILFNNQVVFANPLIQEKLETVRDHAKNLLTEAEKQLEIMKFNEEYKICGKNNYKAPNIMHNSNINLWCHTT